ncbi:Uncharacterised protein [Klebsiella pneumoniae]|nr:Uncharacterised protein [Klebsiella pneumoniae]
MTLYLADTEQTKTQTFTANYWPLLSSLHLFTEEFRLEERLRGHGLGTWITQQFVLWARGLPPETRVWPIDISKADEKSEENQIRRDRLWHAMGFRFPAGQNCSMPLRVDELQLPRSRSSALRVEPLASGVRRLEEGYRGLQEKILQLEGEILSKKQLIGSIKKHPFLHLLHRKWRPLPDGKCDALPLRAEKLSLPQSGDSDLELEQPGSSGWLPCVLSRRKGSLSWKEILPRKVRSSLTCRHIHFLTCWRNLTTRAGSGWACWLFWALSTGCWGHECSRSIATH